ncbi:MAG: S9 family peptidase [Bacteroidota bacterium]
MVKNRLLIALVCIVALGSHSIAQQKKVVTLEDIWSKNVFGQKTVSGVNWKSASQVPGGAFYTSLVSGMVVKYDAATGMAVDTLVTETALIPTGTTQAISIHDYTLSADENKLLISSQSEPIYRRSSKAVYYIYDLKSRQLSSLSKGGKQANATFSPNGTQVAFTRDNNLFVTDLTTLAEKAITTDGKVNQLIHGSTDWVYEEEFSFVKAFDWSPDGKKIAYYSFDESQVPEYNMQVWGEGVTDRLYPKDYRFKYPKAGEANSQVALSIFNLDKNQAVKVDLGSETNMYIPRIQWTKNPNLLSVRKLNRLQNRLDILHADATTGKVQTILTEESKTYVDVEFTDDLTYLSNQKYFILSSERSGFKHLYLYDMAGKLIRQLTAGNWEITSFLGIDEKAQLLYFTSTEVSPLERHLFSITMDGKNKVKLTAKAGNHTINFSPDLKFYLDYHASAEAPLTVSLHKAPAGSLVKVLESNEPLKARLDEYSISKKEFFQFNTTGGISLNGWMIKPANFDASKKYPVLMFVYGGPGSQTVLNNWESRDFFWYQVLAQQGYLVVSIDNRGTGGRGREFKHATYANLGKLEVQDQIEGAKYLGNQPYVDASRIGIWGWSYGGYMSSLCMTVGADYFKTGIAVAPVTSWRFYDTIYTERYLKTPQENQAGYDDNSPVTHAAKLKGNYFLIHGTGDDNVHFQNAVVMENALIKAGKQFRSFYYPNRSHSIGGGNTRLHLYTMMTNFLEKNL